MVTALVDAIMSHISNITGRLLTRIFVVPGYLGAEMDRGMIALGDMDNVLDEQALLMQARRITVAKVFWKMVGFNALL
jgi:hypothetical protein